MKSFELKKKYKVCTELLFEKIKKLRTYFYFRYILNLKSVLSKMNLNLPKNDFNCPRNNYMFLNHEIFSHFNYL